MNFNRNVSLNNLHSVEKAMQKFQQLAKEAQSNGDPVLVENYLQHADHYHRRLNELNEKNILLYVPARQMLPNHPLFTQIILDKCKKLVVFSKGLTLVLSDDMNLKINC